MMPTVSINLCCFNSQKYLEETLQSVFAQSLRDWELVIVDDGSTDGTEVMIQEHVAAGRNIVYHKQANAGLSNARNQAIRLSKGDYIVFLDHDDVLMPSALEDQVHIVQQERAALAYGGYTIINTQGTEKMHLLPRHRSGILIGKLLRRYEMFAPSGVLVERKTLQDLELTFDPNLTMTEDYCLFLMIAAERRVAVSRGIVAKVRVHVGSLTSLCRDRWAPEHDYTHALIERRFPGIKEKYAGDFRQAEARSRYFSALWLMQKGRKKDAIMEMRKIVIVLPKYFFIFLVLVASPTLWTKLQTRLCTNRNLG